MPRTVWTLEMYDALSHDMLHDPDLVPPVFSRKLRRKIRSLLLQREPYCWFCGVPLELTTATLDHLHPRCRRGRHCLKNLRLACDGCNQRKGAALLHEIACIARRGGGIVFLMDGSHTFWRV